jgi:hypothetical protein
VHIYLRGLADFSVKGRGQFGYQFRVVSKNGRPAAGIDQVLEVSQPPYPTDGTVYNRYAGS